MADLKSDLRKAVQSACTLKEPELRVALAWWLCGDDLTASTDDRNTKAVNDWLRNSDEWMLLTRCFGRSRQPLVQRHSRGIVTSEYKIPDTDIWTHRHGKPWQSDLESHVAAWRAEPPELTADMALSLFDKGDAVVFITQQEVCPKSKLLWSTLCISVIGIVGNSQEIRCPAAQHSRSLAPVLRWCER